MRAHQIGKETGNPVGDIYNREGLILDCYLSGEISHRAAMELATFFNADEVLPLLKGIYNPDHPSGPVPRTKEWLAAVKESERSE